MLRAIPGVELVEMEHNREDGLCYQSAKWDTSETEHFGGCIDDRESYILLSVPSSCT